MNEKILKTLMHLFAIIAPAQGSDIDRRMVVETFLRRQLNLEGVHEYLRIFDDYYTEAQDRLKKGNEVRRNAAISVRIIKICYDIGPQLTIEQKIIILVQLLEYCKSDSSEVSSIELEFILTAADGFNIDREDYQLIEKFILSPSSEIPDSKNILVIDNVKDHSFKNAHHLCSETVKGQVRVLNIPSAEMLFVRAFDTGEIFMSGQLLHEDKVYLFNRGASLKYQNSVPVYYSDVMRNFLNEKLLASRVVYEVKEIEYRFMAGNVGLHKMSFSEESGRLVGIMGASGAGKSTLLNVLNGINKPHSGEVLINGIDIHRNAQKVKGLIGFVSQDDLLIEELTVYENLFYNAKLCFGNLNDEEINDKVCDVLKSLGLYEIRDMKVGTPLNKKISGGQRKRLNISLELIREPFIMFLDEPTSGLSSIDSENILDLLKDLALKGKLLFVVIHQPSSDIFKMFDRLLFLDSGGYLIYDGNPIESIVYFKQLIHHANYNESECRACGNVNPEQIFNIVESKVLNELGQPTKTRKISPFEWNKYYEQNLRDKVISPEPGNGIPEIKLKTPGWIKQFVVFVKRDILAKLSDMQYLVITLLEAPILAFFLAYIIRYFNEGAASPAYSLMYNDNLPVYIFMSVIVAIFMGLTVSAEEIIKDRKILKREAFLNLSWSSYLISKITVQFIISALQAFSFVLIGNTIMQIKGMWFDYWLVLFSCWSISNMMGLLISDSFKTVVTIYILIPFLVIPQIILSGIIVKYEKLNPVISSPVSIPFYGEIMVARWGYEALSVDQYINNRFERMFYDYDKIISVSKYKREVWYNEMNSIISTVEGNLERNRLYGAKLDDIVLLQNEISKELIKTPQVTCDVSQLMNNHITPEALASARDYIELVRKYYMDISKDAVSSRDRKIEIQEEADKEEFIRLKKEYTNESLEDFVRNQNEKEKIVRFKNQLYQNYDQIYLDPEKKLIKAHFYAPRKQVFGVFVDTLTVNVAVIWLMTILLYILLYFKLLQRTLDYFEKTLKVYRNRKNQEQ
jgi:ABC transport system ATP-binding/permease protein